MAFVVEIDDGQQVWELKNAIKNGSDEIIKVHWPKLQLFLAKKDGGWMRDVDPGVLELTKGWIHPDVQALIDGEMVGDASTIKDVLEENHMTTPQSSQVHVLVVVPTAIVINVGGLRCESVYTRELRYYQQRGNLIKVQHTDYCGQILNKIDQLYEDKICPLPFICVEGSSGMGKTQLAFALGGGRPWFYWPAIEIGVESQNLYRNFEKISDAFNEITLKDNPVKLSEPTFLPPIRRFTRRSFCGRMDSFSRC